MRQYLPSLHVCLLLCFFSTLTTAQVTERGIAKVTPNQIVDTGKIYGVVIGISTYDKLPSLQYADKDAKAFYQYLESMPVPANRKDVSLFLNTDANRSAIADKLYSIADDCKPGDKVYLYFGGHGDLEQLVQTDNCLLLLANSDKKNYLRNANGYLDMNLLRAFFKVWADKKVQTIFVCDACHSGALSGGETGVKNTLVSLQQSWMNEVRLLSCQPDELSLEGPQWGGGRGLFSYYLVLGLQGLADEDKDNTVSLMELGDFLKDSVKIQSAKTQVPSLNGNMRMVLNKVTPLMLADAKNTLLKKYNPQFDKTALAMRGNEDAIVELLKNPKLLEAYQTFKQRVAVNQLFSPENFCAISIYNQFPDTASAHIAKNTMRLILIDKLQLPFNRLLTYLYNDNMDKFGANEWDNIEQSLSYCISLISKGHYLYNALSSQQKFIDACKLTEGLNPYSKQGVDYFDKLETGISLLKQAITLNPQQPYLYLRLGDYCLYSSKFTDAITNYTYYQQLLPKDEYALNKLGLAYTAVKDYDKAIGAFKTALRINPQFFKAQTNLAIVMQKKG